MSLRRLRLPHASLIFEALEAVQFLSFFGSLSGKFPIARRRKQGYDSGSLEEDRGMKPLAIALFLVFLAVPLFGDSVTMVNYYYPSGSCCRLVFPMVPGTEQIDLFTSNWNSPTTPIQFFGVVDSSQFSSMSWTFTSAGTGTVTITFTPQSCSGANPVFYCYGAFQIPTHDSDHGPFLGSLTVNLNAKLTQTYNFQFLIPVPEPSTFLFLGTGVAGIGWRKFRLTKS